MTVLVVASVILLLIFINALYVAAEFSAVSARRPRLARMADDGNRMAALILSIVEDPQRLDAYVAACQLGITASSLLLGFYGQSRIMELLTPWLLQVERGTYTLVQSILATVILLGLTVLQVIFGELIPKNVGLRFPEQLSLLTAFPMRWSVTLFKPLIWLFNGSGRIILHLMGMTAVGDHSHVHSPEEILMLVEESTAGGLLNREERRLLVNTLQLRHQIARKIMIPRNRMLTASADSQCSELFTMLAASPFSRLPLYDGSIDKIVGVVHTKDLLKVHYQQSSSGTADTALPARRIMHPVHHIPETVEVGDVLALLQRAHHNLAIIVDEYGGTAGMITVEDLIEEIIGEFSDEFDVEHPALRPTDVDQVRVRGDVLLDDINEALGLNLSTSEVDSIGGLVMQVAGRVPEVGETVELGETSARVDEKMDSSVTSVTLLVDKEQMTRLRRLLREEGDSFNG